MTPARVPLTITGALSHRMAAVAHAAATAPAFDPLLVVSVVAILVSVAIAIWQYSVAKRYRKIDEAKEAQRLQQEELVRSRRANRESWEESYQQCRDLLTRLEDIESEVRDQGPLTTEKIDVPELGRIQRRLENLSERYPSTLSAPLQTVARAVGTFKSVRILSDREVTKDYDTKVAATPKDGSAPLIPAEEVGAAAISQYREAERLHTAICGAWKAINTERGESLVRRQDEGLLTLIIHRCVGLGYAVVGGASPDWPRRPGCHPTGVPGRVQPHVGRCHVSNKV